MTDSNFYEMQLEVDYILLRVLSEDSRRRASPEFANQVINVLGKLFEEIDGLVTAISVRKSEIKVNWKAEGVDPLTGIISLLEKKRYREAVLLLELFKSARPYNPDFLYNLGMAYSDLGELGRALANLHRLLELDPDHINGRVALGVELMRQGQDGDAIKELKKAIDADPNNPWAQRNLAACLMRTGAHKEALPYLRKAVELNPTDERAWFGLGQALDMTGSLDDADAAYQKVLDLDEFGDIAKEARQAHSKIAQKKSRSVRPNRGRIDATMYCLDALEKYETMAPEKVKQVCLEVAMIGMSGIDVNDPTPTYHLNSFPGTFSGLHLLCLEYVSFQQFSPETDTGFDLKDEYQSAQKLFRARRNQENSSP